MGNVTLGNKFRLAIPGPVVCVSTLFLASLCVSYAAGFLNIFSKHCFQVMTFPVVLFPEEDDCVAVVPRLWLKGGVCYWPPPSITSRKSFSHDKFARTCSPPEDTWEAVPNNLIKHAGEFENVIIRNLV